MKIVSGGQTGVDRAALDAALFLGWKCGGWCPRGRKAEDGKIDLKYPLLETPSTYYPERTEFNVRNSDATLILTWGKPSGGTRLTMGLAKKHKKPHFIIDMSSSFVQESIIEWIKQNEIQTLNVAGPRGSSSAHIYNDAYEFLVGLFRELT